MVINVFGLIKSDEIVFGNIKIFFMIFLKVDELRFFLYKN